MACSQVTMGPARLTLKCWKAVEPPDRTMLLYSLGIDGSMRGKILIELFEMKIGQNTGVFLYGCV